MGAPPGGLWHRGRREGLAPFELADRHGPRADLRPRPLPPHLLRLRRRVCPSAGAVRRDLHAELLRRFGLVLLGPRPVLLVPDRPGPRDRPDAELSGGPSEPAAPPVPVVLPPCRADPLSPLRERVAGGLLHVPPQHGPVRRP